MDGMVSTFGSGQAAESQEREICPTTHVSYVSVVAVVLIPEIWSVMANVVIKNIKRFLADEDGPTAVEYAVMIMLIFLAVLSMVQLVGLMTADSFKDSSDKIQGAVGNGS